ncbi:MAG: hypothetical protein V4582_11890 [Pseudomonadota bacterium]
MNIAKNMEVIFVVAIALFGISSFASAAVPSHYHHVRKAAVAVQDDGQVTVVKVSAKRLTAAQKAQIAN